MNIFTSSFYVCCLAYLTVYLGICKIYITMKQMKRIGPIRSGLEEVQLPGIDWMILELSLANSRCLSSDKMLFLPCNEIVSLFWCTHNVFYLSLHIIPGICSLSSLAKSLECHVLLLKRFRKPQNLRHNKIAIYAKVILLK